ncbi:hypothetical protein ACFWVB_20210 [Streptomyces microflavus]|uniref:glycine-rich domain-containing protein n=1 Tax=Streptomyces microflavus TaxID=1919 RepID=UPI0036567AB3
MAEVCVCADYFTVSDSGELCLLPGTMGIRERLVFATPGNFTFTAADYPWLSRIDVQVQGGGGGSAGANSDAGESIFRPGAPGGAYARRLIEVGLLGASESIVVGAGGLGGFGVSNSGGTAGGTSLFGGLVTAASGLGGPPNMASGNSPATARGGPGATGGAGDYVIGGGGAGASIRLNAADGFSGFGGDSHLGHGGEALNVTGVGNGPTGYGGGGGGSVAIGDTTVDGAPGGGGIVIIDLYG